MKKTKNKMTMVEPNSLAESPNKAIVKKKNRNNKKKKNKAFKNMNGNIGTLVSDATVVVAPAISKEGKKMKKKKNKNVEHLNESTCGPQTDVSMKDAPTVPKKNKDISDANDSADVLGNKSIKDLDNNIHLPVANVSVSETVAISKNGVKDLKENVEIPMDDKEGINDSSEISKKDIDKKAENSMIDIPVNCESTISKKKKKKKKEQEKQQPVVEGEAFMKDIEEIKDNSETPMKDVDEKEEHSQIDVSVTSTSTISKKKKKRKKKKKKEQEPVTEGEVLMKDTEEINDNAKTPMKDIEDIDEKAENSGIDMSVTSISTISKKKKKKQQQQQQPVTEVTLDSSVVTTDVTAELPSVSTNNRKADGDPGEPDTDGKKKNKKKKRKISEVESTITDISCDVNDEISEAQSTTTGTSSNVNIASKIARKESEAKKETTKGFTQNLEEEGRAIIVGNVTVKNKCRDVARIFSKYGKIETVRKADPKKNKKETVITGNYNSLQTSGNVYVRFETKDMMIAALEANGMKLKGKHLRVDKAPPTEDQSIRHSVFVGNLPIEAEEEALRSHFADCGEIHSVSLIRDRDFASCKEFGYVNFVSPDSVEFALQLNNKIFMHRQLRVQRCVEKSKNKKMEKMSKNKPGMKGLGFVNLQMARTEKNKPKADGDFSGMKMV